MSLDLQKLISLSGNIPFNEEEDVKPLIENFCSENIAVIVTNNETSITQGTHQHNSYEFVICYTKIPGTIIENKSYDRENNTLFAVNPMQEHGMAADLKGFSLCGLHIDKSLIESVSMGIYGSSNVLFANDSYALTHDISMMVRLFLEELKYKQSGYEYMIENISILIVGSLLRQIRHNLSYMPLSIPPPNKESITAVIDYMNENYTVGVSCAELSKLAKMDKFGFIRNFKAEIGKTPYEYLLDLKIEKAKKMLKTNQYTITEISMMCGFSSHSHFSSSFKKKTGISPTEYKLTP